MESTNTPAIKAADTATMVQWRNIQKVVRELADFCFGSADNAMYGVCHVALINALTAKDGLSVTLEPLPDTPAIQAVDPILTDAFILASIEVVREHQHFPSLMFPSDAATIAFAREIERAALAAVPAQQPTEKLDKSAFLRLARMSKHGVKSSGETMGHDDFFTFSASSLFDFYCSLVAPAAPVAPDLARQVKKLPSMCWWHADGYPVFNNMNGGDLILRKDVERLLSHSAQAPVELENYKLVPLKATLEMQKRGAQFDVLHAKRPYAESLASEIYSAMLLVSPKIEPVSEDKRDAELAARCVNIASQCRATASSEVALMVIVDGGSGTLRELLIDAADAIAATPSPTKEST